MCAPADREDWRLIVFRGFRDHGRSDKTIIMKVTIFGTSYVGSVNGACQEDTGHGVICMECRKSQVIDAISLFETLKTQGRGGGTSRREPYSMREAGALHLPMGRR